MSRLAGLKLLVNQRLNAAVEEIFGHFERAIVEYEEEMERRHRRLLEELLTPGIKLPHADLQQLLVSEEVWSGRQQEWSSSLDRDQEDPEPPHIKEEQEELWTSQEQFEELDVTKLTFTCLPMKSEDDEEKPEDRGAGPLISSATQHLKVEVDGDDSAGPEPVRILDPDPLLHPDPEDRLSDSSETDVSDDEGAAASKPQSGASRLPVSDVSRGAADKSFRCSECGQRFGRKSHLNTHMRIHSGEKPFSCSFCGKRFSQKGDSVSHMRRHTGEKPFSCSVCQKSFRYSGHVSRHMRTHTGKKTQAPSDKRAQTASEDARNSDQDGRLQPVAQDKPSECESDHSDGWKESRDPQSGLDSLKEEEVHVSGLICSAGKELFSCRECGRTFCRRDLLISHMRTHTGEKPFSCKVCKKRFRYSGHVSRHMRIHTGEKPFGCSVCSKRFNQNTSLQMHMRIHTGEKPFGCTVCGKRFTQKRRLVRHMAVHSKEKLFKCSTCEEGFTWLYQLKNHLSVCVH